MIKYTSDFLKQANDDEVYQDSKKTYFTPWWQLWNRKVKTERAWSGDFMREFDEAGNLVSLMRTRSKLHPSGFGPQYYWETLDMKTKIITAEPYSGCKKYIFPDGKCQEVTDCYDGTQEVVWGFINNDGNNEAHVKLHYKNGKQISCQWLKGNHTSQAWKDVLKENPVNLEERARKLAEVVEKYREGKEIPTDESELREFKDNEEKAKLNSRMPEARKMTMSVKIRRRRAGR